MKSVLPSILGNQLKYSEIRIRKSYKIKLGLLYSITFNQRFSTTKFLEKNSSKHDQDSNPRIQIQFA